jgi:predicted DCC family thiol-disulfide oxidoreductase YuxK
MAPELGEHPVVLFDGVCNLCSSAVQFIIDRDPKATFRFASLQSEAGAALLHSTA